MEMNNINILSQIAFKHNLGFAHELRNEETLQLLVEACSRLRDYITKLNPDFIITSGNSAALIKNILSTFEIKGKIIHLDSKMNNIIYKNQELDDIERPILLELALAQKFPEFPRDGSAKILFIDEHSESNYQMRCYREIFDSMGFKNNFCARLATTRKNLDTKQIDFAAIVFGDKNSGELFFAVTCLEALLSSLENQDLKIEGIDESKQEEAIIMLREEVEELLTLIYMKLRGGV